MVETQLTVCLGFAKFGQPFNFWRRWAFSFFLNYFFSKWKVIDIQKSIMELFSLKGYRSFCSFFWLWKMKYCSKTTHLQPPRVEWLTLNWCLASVILFVKIDQLFYFERGGCFIFDLPKIVKTESTRKLRNFNSLRTPCTRIISRILHSFFHFARDKDVKSHL